MLTLSAVVPTARSERDGDGGNRARRCGGRRGRRRLVRDHDGERDRFLGRERRGRRGGAFAPLRFTSGGFNRRRQAQRPWPGSAERTNRGREVGLGFGESEAGGETAQAAVALLSTKGGLGGSRGAERRQCRHCGDKRKEEGERGQGPTCQGFSSFSLFPFKTSRV